MLLARCGAGEIAWHRWEQPEVVAVCEVVLAVCGVVPVAAEVRVFPAGIFRHYRGTTTVFCLFVDVDLFGLISHRTCTVQSNAKSVSFIWGGPGPESKRYECAAAFLCMGLQTSTGFTRTLEPWLLLVAGVMSDGLLFARK